MDVMPGDPRAIITEAERRLPIRIVIGVPGDGIGYRYLPMCEFLAVCENEKNENRGCRKWQPYGSTFHGNLGFATEARKAQAPACEADGTVDQLVRGIPRLS
jgi:hypothetical protein